MSRTASMRTWGLSGLLVYAIFIACATLGVIPSY
jgi:hypothetical protein